ncbi:hypothetical protein Tco_1086278, partial [Tanacetum coccineum]
MDNTRAQQKALDDELVAPADRLKIGKINLRLSLILKFKEPTLQVALDALKATPFYNAFEISADVPKIYMQEFWVTVSRHHSSLRFKLNGKSYTVNVDNFRDMLKICPKLPSQIFEEPPLEEEIISFIRELGHTEEIKFLFDVNVNHMHQPWRSFAAIINKCLSGKTTALESIRLSRAQILWGMYHNKTVDYVYLLWDDLVYQGIPRRNKMFWHYARDDFMFTTSEAYMTYRAYATGEKTPKPKTTKKKDDSKSSPKTKSTQASKGKRITTLAKGDKPAKKKQSATNSKGLTVLSEVALTEAQQMKIAIERSKIQTHSSQASGSGVGDKPEVPDVLEYRSESEEEFWTYNNDVDDFVYPNLSTYKADDQEEQQEEEKANDDDDVSSDQMVSTPPDYEVTKEEENQEDDDNTEEVHVTLTTEPTVVQQQSSYVSSDFVSKFINPSPDTGAEVLARSSNQPQTSYAAAASLSEFELKKIRIDKIKENKSMNRGRDDQDKDEEPSFGSNQGTKRKISGKEESSKEATQKESKFTSSSKGASISQPKSSGKSAQVEEHGPRVDDLEEPLHQEFNTGNDYVSLVREIIVVDERLWNPSGSQTPDHEWNKTKTFLATPIDFSAFIMNRLTLNNLTQDVLTGPTYDLMKDMCKSVVELEYHLKEVFKATNDQLDWHNPEGRPYPHDLSKPLPLIQNTRGRQIEDKVPKSIWSLAQVVYDKHAYWGTYHWGPKHQRFYGYATNMEPLKDVYSRHKIIAITSLKIMELFGYKHLEEITVQRQDDQLYKFREGDFKRLRRQDIKDMLLLLFK